MVGERKGKFKGREVYHGAGLPGKPKPVLAGGSGPSSPLALLTTLTSCPAQTSESENMPLLRENAPRPCCLGKNEEQGDGSAGAFIL